VGTLEFRCALEPARARKGEKQGPQFFQGWADGVDLEKQTLCIEEAVDDKLQSVALAGERGVGDVQKKVEKGKMFDMSWDKLVVAVGCYSQTFDTKGVREHAYFLKDVGDARKIRNRLLSCFEMASLPTTSEEMKKMLLNFAVVGGGPTGIEWSAELCDMIEEDMKHLYPDLVGYAKVYQSSNSMATKRATLTNHQNPDHSLRRRPKSPKHVRRKARHLRNETLPAPRHLHPNLAPRRRAPTRRPLSPKSLCPRRSGLLHHEAQRRRRSRRGNVRLEHRPDDEPVRREAPAKQSRLARENARHRDGRSLAGEEA
jgi:hypothetical protein